MVASSAPPRVGSRAYAELAARLFGGADSRKAVAFASVNPGEGVTRTVRGVAAELVRCGKTVATLDGTVETQPIILGAPRIAEPETPATMIAKLRERYDYLLFDCGSLESSVDLLRVAPLADGVVMIVEAGRTGKDQLSHATRLIREANGAVVGCVLNKRSYPIPAWLYRHL